MSIHGRFLLHRDIIATVRNKRGKNRQCVFKRTTGALFPALVPIIAHVQQPTRKKEHVSSKYPQLAAVPTQSPNPKSGYAFHHRYEMFRIIFNFTEHIHKAYFMKQYTIELYYRCTLIACLSSIP